MHGRLKVKSSEEQVNEKRIEKQKKLHKYQLLCTDILQCRNTESNSLLVKTAAVLITNPDIYTFWNIRKEVLLNIKKDGSGDAEELFKKELCFLNDCLKSNSKSYGAWQHRCFVMEIMDKPDWKNELDLCSKYLEVDGRNFHCWDYRRYVVRMSKEPLESELDFTTNQIRTDFSNFSSWHYRSKILSELHSTKDNQIKESVLNYELSLVENAMFTDPSDQSGWFYHKWLLNKKGELVSIERVFEDIENKKLMLLLSYPLQISDISLKVSINGEEKTFKMETANKKKFCKLMVVQLNLEEMGVGDNVSNELKIELSGPRILKDKSTILIKLDDDYSNFYATNKSDDDDIPTQSILKRQYDSIKELHVLEPDNKFTLHALMSLKRHFDASNYHEEALSYFNELISLDPFRLNYYLDFVNRLKVEKKIEELDGCMRSINLSGMSLSSACCLERLCAMKCINLSYNNLVSLSEAYFLQCAEVLILHHNQISNCSGISQLEELVIIDLSYNEIHDVEDLWPLRKCPKLETLLIKGNPITFIPDYEELIRKNLPNVKNVQ